MDVVFADDDVDIRKEVEEAFEEFRAAGAKTRCGKRSFSDIKIFKNKKAALEYLDEMFSKEVEYPFLIISDLRMENSQAGIELCKFVRHRSNSKHIPFVIVSQADNEADIDKSFSAGANLYIVKGEEPEFFPKAIREIFKLFSETSNIPHRTVVA